MRQVVMEGSGEEVSVTDAFRRRLWWMFIVDAAEERERQRLQAREEVE